MTSRSFVRALLAVALACGTLVAQPAAAAVLIEDFNDNVLDAAMWTTAATGGPSVAAANQRLEFTFPANASGSTFSVQAKSRCQMAGDFDMHVSFNLFTWPSPNGVRTGILLQGPHGGTQRTSLGNGQEIYASDFGNGNLTLVGTSDRTGAMRIRRAGSTLYTYYRSGSTWQPLGTGAVPTTNLGFTLAGWSHDYDFKDRLVQFAFDDFTIESGSLVCPKPVARLAWTVADALGARDADGLLIYPAPQEIRDPVRTVRFDACASTPSTGATLTTFRYSIDGGPLLNLSGSCIYPVSLPPGAHSAQVMVEDSSGATDTTTITFTLRDYLVVSLGDSFASGEGNPERGLGAGGPTWQSRQCHRSGLAGTALAALDFERSDAQSTVTFVHLACSGATIESGIIGPYGGVESDQGPELPSQLKQLSMILDPDQTGTFARDIDSVLISVGGNDVGFGGIIEGCLVQYQCNQGPNAAPICSTGLADRSPTCRNVPLEFQQAVTTLPGKFAKLAACLSGDFGCPAGSPTLTIPPERIHITQYPDLTRAANGDYCERIEGGIDYEEAKWASQHVLATLNAEVQSAANDHGWEFVDGVLPPFVGPPGHGMCADDHWFVTIGESFAGQRNQNGAFHPNNRGQQIYRDAILAAGMF